MSEDSQAHRSLRPLLTEEGWELLASLSAITDDDQDNLNNLLRKQGHAPDLVAAVLTQQQLRVQAGNKFGEFAEQMLFTRQGLEQATRLPVAAHHSQRFKNAGISEVFDIGCGIGGDTLAMAANDLKVTGIETDEAVAAAATVNLMPFENATIIHASAEEFLAEQQPVNIGLWFDPARRNVQAAGGATKIFNPQDYTPSLDLIGRLVDQGQPVGVKLAPGMPHESLPESVRSRGEVQYVSHNRDLVEVTLWFNALARPDIRRSALILQDAQPPVEFTAATTLDQARVGNAHGIEGLQELIGHGFIYEPDPALIRSRLVAEAVESVGGYLFDEHIAYFGSPELRDSTAWQVFAIDDVLPYNIKKLRSWIKAEGIGSLTIKKRGMDVSPQELRNILLAGLNKATRKNGSHCTLVLTRIGTERVAIKVSPV